MTQQIFNQEPENSKRKRGGQPGNINALKTGRFRSKDRKQPVKVTRSEELSTIDQLIFALKRTMANVDTVRIPAANIQEYNDTMRSLAYGANSLCRLLYLRDRLVHYPHSLIPASFQAELEILNSVFQSVIDGDPFSKTDEGLKTRFV